MYQPRSGFFRRTDFALWQACRKSVKRTSVSIARTDVASCTNPPSQNSLIEPLMQTVSIPVASLVFPVPGPPCDHISIDENTTLLVQVRHGISKPWGLSRNVTLCIIDQPRLDPGHPKALGRTSQSASNLATGAVSSTWMPPRFLWSASWNGSLQPPSPTGVLNHRRIRWRRGMPLSELWSR